MKRRLLAWAIAAVVLLGLAAAVWRAVSTRRAEALAVTTVIRPAAVELMAADVARAIRTELKATLSISGSLKAVNSAIVKAKVAAEVKEILVREGDRVVAGQIVGRLDDTEYQWRLRQAEDQAAAAKAQLEIAERTLANNKALVDQGFISKTALDTSVSSANGALASLQAARAAAEIARKSVKDTEIRAPLAGLVAQRLVQPGERVPVDGRMLEIVDLSKIELEAALAPEDVVAVRVGQNASVLVDGLADPMAAKVARINPGTQGGSRSVMTYLAVEPGPALRQGLFARGTIELRRQQALVVPVSALRSEQSRPALVVAQGGRAVLRNVSLGARGEVDLGAGREAGIEVLSGLSEGDVVLRASVGALPAGTALILPKADAQPLPASAAAR